MRGERIRGGEKQSGIGTERNETRRNEDAWFGDGGWSRIGGARPGIGIGSG